MVESVSSIADSWLRGYIETGLDSKDKDVALLPYQRSFSQATRLDTTDKQTTVRNSRAE